VLPQVSTTPPGAGHGHPAWSEHRPDPWRRRLLPAALRHPVVTTVVVAGLLQLLWWLVLANSGGDIAAQDAWAEFARKHPWNAYNFAWYGGIHPVSYSVLSPYLMAGVGVRATMMIAATVSAGVMALLLARIPAVRRPLPPALVGAVALLGNSISGRTTFVLGMMFALGAVAVVFVWPRRWRGADPANRWVPWARGALVAALSLLATFGSPVDGLFLGLLAATLWLQRRRPAAYALGLPPVCVVVLAKLFFPLSGVQPMHWPSVILPCLMALFVFWTAPRSWRVLRLTTLVYVVAVVGCWLVPSPIGTNVTRLGLIFGGVALTAILVSGKVRTPLPALLRIRGRTWQVPVVLFASLALATSGVWQVTTAARDLVRTTPDKAWDLDTAAVTAELTRLGAQYARVEVVPSASHREVSALSPPFVLARGWNRQVDAKYNARFYDRETPLTDTEYRRWLDAWAVAYVVVPPGRPDTGSLTELELIDRHPGYLSWVWSRGDWRIYRVADPTPTVSGGGKVLQWDEAGMRIRIPRAGYYVIKEKYSRHMVLTTRSGETLPSPESLALNTSGCVEELPPPPDPNGADSRTGSDTGSGTGSGPDARADASAGEDGPTPDETQDETQERTGWTVLRAPAGGDYQLTSDYTHDTACPES